MLLTTLSATTCINTPSQGHLTMYQLITQMYVKHTPWETAAIGLQLTADYNTQLLRCPCRTVVSLLGV